MFFYIFLFVFLVKEIWELVLDVWNKNYATSPNAKIPEIFKDIITEEDFEKSKKYLIDRTNLGVISHIVDIILSVVLIIWGYPYFEKLVSSLTSSYILQGLLFFGILGLINLIISIPFDVYSTFVIEEKYGFNTTTPKTFITDIIKSILVAIILGVPLLSFLLWIIETDPNWWWKFALVVIVFEIFISWLYPMIIAPLFNKFYPLEDQELKEKILSLLEKAHFKISKVFVMDASRRTKRVNAYLTGIGNSRRVVLFDTILSYSHEEILAVLAHELGHNVKKHIPKIIILSSLFYTAYIYFVYFLYKSPLISQAFSVEKNFTLIVYSFIFVSSIAYFISPIINAISRKFEYEADRFSKELLGTPKPLISALKRLVKENLSNLNPLPLYRTWYYSHPAPEERILALRG
ncbi:MAG: peptidase [Dictyoglomus sp. NZ13-RE01]|nr:MAG: peptidase [Dictyoglomus sp. NZ13-RE01]